MIPNGNDRSKPDTNSNDNSETHVTIDAPDVASQNEAPPKHTCAARMCFEIREGGGERRGLDIGEAKVAA